MKGFFYGLSAGLAAGVVAQMMIAKNHEQMLELVRNLPRPLKFGSSNTIDELLAQKERLEDLIQKKQEELSASEEEEEAENEENPQESADQ